MKKQETEKYNALTIGEITLQSSDMHLKELFKLSEEIFQNKTIKDYLSDLSQRKLMNLSKSYVG